jgi:hypothetical protein
MSTATEQVTVDSSQVTAIENNNNNNSRIITLLILSLQSLPESGALYGASFPIMKRIRRAGRNR